SRPGRAGWAARARPRRAGWAAAARRGSNGSRPENVSVVQPIKRAIAIAAERRSELRVGFTARRAVILAAVVCVLTLTVAGPVRTFFAQHAEMKQQARIEAALRSQIADLQQRKTNLADPAHIKAQARQRLGFVMPGEVPYQVQLPPTAELPDEPGGQSVIASIPGPWYAALWHTIADTPHEAPVPEPEPEIPAVLPGTVPPVAPGG
ncbi:MAG TPA: septum formation initiator family protein, partial [Mycobacterium sp.]|nr:septum formation initiator family protein [Mycobacterium sp.]